MAKKAYKPKKTLTKAEKDALKMRRTILLLAALVAVGFFPLFLVFLLGMLPTITLMITEKTEQKYKTKAVGFPNFIGTFHMITPMLKYEGMQTIDNAISIVTNATNYIYPLSASLIGYILVTFLPIVVNLYLAKAQVIREKKLMEDRNKIINLWGEEVNKDAPNLITLEQLRAEELNRKLRESMGK